VSVACAGSALHYTALHCPAQVHTPSKFDFMIQCDVHQEAIEYQAPYSGILIILANKNVSFGEKQIEHH
jgi:hypothetical protein